MYDVENTTALQLNNNAYTFTLGVGINGLYSKFNTTRKNIMFYSVIKCKTIIQQSNR